MRLPGSNPGKTDSSWVLVRGWYPVIVAAFCGQLSTVETLLAAGAKVNEPNAAGQTALMLAASVGQAQMCDLLLRKGADPTASCNGGMKARWYAQICKHRPTIKVFDTMVGSLGSYPPNLN